jgi:Peptidase S46
VYAPPESVGNYGGETDNWRWPRHTGDVSIFRAYVGADGAPADYAASNVPFASKKHLSVATKPLREGDLVMVAGYPGRTNSLKTSVEIDEYIGFRYPHMQKLCEEILAKLATITEPEAKIRATPLVRRYGNGLTNFKGQLEGLSGGLAKTKADREALLGKFIESDSARKAKWGTALSAIDKAYAEVRKHRVRDLELRQAIMVGRLVGAATTIVRMAEERAKADKDRHPDYQERNWPRLIAAQEALEKQYSREVDVVLLSLALEREARFDKVDRVGVASIIAKLSPEKTSSPAFLFDSVLTKTEARVELLKKATVAELKKSKDPMIRFALALRPLLKEMEEREEGMNGRLAAIKPIYIAALREFEGKEIAPDANSTLRLTYGTVRGYAPKPDAPIYRPFTTLSQMIAKDTGKEPFDVPKRVTDAFAAKMFGAYVDAELGEVPVDFLSDVHSTGGNSGSATLNGNGEITGLLFDGNYESLASDWQFQPKLTRAIHVDIRYVEWLLDAVEGGGAILKEMGVTPSVHGARG